MNPTAIYQDGPLHVSTTDPRIGFFWAEGQVTETFHERPADVIAYVDHDVYGDRMAEALATGNITKEQAVEWAALVSEPSPPKVAADPLKFASDMFSPEGRPMLEQFVALGKRQILNLIGEGRCPNNITAFRDLHNYCDANCLGGLCVDAIHDRADAYFRTDKDEADCMSAGMHAFSEKVHDILGQWLRLRQPNPHGQHTDLHPIATPFKVAFDGPDCEPFSAFTIGDSWNGFACPYFIKEIADFLVADLNNTADMPRLHYEAGIDSFVEVIDNGDGTSDRDEWKGLDIATANGFVHVYAIGSHGWTWTVVDPEESEGEVDEAPEHTDATLRRAFMVLQSAATDLMQEMGAAVQQGRDPHDVESDLWPSADEMLEALGTWAQQCADSIHKEGK